MYISTCMYVCMHVCMATLHNNHSLGSSQLDCRAAPPPRRACAAHGVSLPHAQASASVTHLCMRACAHLKYICVRDQLYGCAPHFCLRRLIDSRVISTAVCCAAWLTLTILRIRTTYFALAWCAYKSWIARPLVLLVVPASNLHKSNIRVKIYVTTIQTIFNFF